MKENPLSELPVLISSAQAKDSCSPSFIPHLCAGGLLLTQRSKVILWPAFPGHLCGQACQLVGMSVCVVFVYVCTHISEEAQ